jgi:hypothetical protein
MIRMGMTREASRLAREAVWHAHGALCRLECRGAHRVGAGIPRDYGGPALGRFELGRYRAVTPAAAALTGKVSAVQEVCPPCHVASADAGEAAHRAGAADEKGMASRMVQRHCHVTAAAAAAAACAAPLLVAACRRETAQKVPHRFCHVTTAAEASLVVLAKGVAGTLTSVERLCRR